MWLFCLTKLSVFSSKQNSQAYTSSFAFFNLLEFRILSCDVSKANLWIDDIQLIPILAPIQ